VVEHHLAKVRVASSNLVARSNENPLVTGGFLIFEDVFDGRCSRTEIPQKSRTGRQRIGTDSPG
jgi:hypothetical protein